MREAQAPDPGTIMRLATGYWDSRCFLSAHELGLFEVLVQGPMAAEAIASKLGLALRPTRLLLKACVGLGLLEEDDRGFRNHPSSQAFLAPGSPIYLGNAVRYGADVWGAWTKLGEAVRTGTPPLKAETYTGDDPEKTRNFVYGMHNRALGIGGALVGMVDLSNRKRLLDVGGGPGTYSALLTRAYPELKATVMDLPAVAALAGEILESMDAAERVHVLPGDYKTTPFPGGNDAVLISGVFHRESEETCRQLIERARDSLVPDGVLIVSDVFTDETGASPTFATLFGLNMMLSAPDGGVHSDSDVLAWMEAAGFCKVERSPFPPPMPHRLVCGKR